MCEEENRKYEICDIFRYILTANCGRSGGDLSKYNKQHFDSL